jgi:carboxyl-terminal processing protease
MPRSPLFPARLLTRAALLGTCLIVLAATGSTGVLSNPDLLPEGALRPTTRERILAPRIASILEQAHYSHRAIDAAFSPQVLERFLSTLDSQHGYFTAADIADFDHWRGAFDAMIHTGQIDPAFAIFDRFQIRNRERMHYALELLATEPDWTVSEQYTFDRDKAPWAKADAELNELWRKRVKADALSLMLTGKKWPEAVEVLRKRYQRVLTRAEQVTADDVFESLMNSYAAAYDPHSAYFSPRNSEEYRIQMSLSYEGIGASLQLIDDYVTIASLLPGGPAAAAGTLHPSDRIIAVGQGHEGTSQEVIGWRLDEVVQLIRGKVGTVVRLQLLPAGAAPGSEEHTIELVRGKVTLENQAAKKEVREIKLQDRTLRVGIITVPSFYEDVAARAAGDHDYRSTTRDVRRLIGELQAGGGIDSLVLDLRGDGGGLLQEATTLTGLFTGRGPVVQVKDRDGHIEVLDDSDAVVAYNGPLAVLVDRTSASASEIFAAAIQDYHRGLVIGQTTFGKGTVQSLVPLDRWSSQSADGQITVTIGKFYRITGESTQLHGVEPDMDLPSAISGKDVGESSLDQPLPWDRIAPVDFRELPTLAPQLPSLERDQRQREASDANYRWLLDGLAALESTRKERSQSLNLKDRERERATQEQERLSRENARRAATGLTPLKSTEDMKTDDLPDVVLAQAAGIAADLATETGHTQYADAKRAAPAR